ncbi:MAG TPA: Yip1 family protein [Lachnospiraceae bacterium]|nr:Yip1 family protein [Lachnospiraceae bacterium]
MTASLTLKEKFKHYLSTLRYAFYILSHPLDGFWDLTHEKRGSVAAATTILVLTILARIMSMQYTNFMFMHVYWDDINIFLYIASIVFPLLLWCVGNWGLTTLFDGKGRLKQVYMSTCYALLPYPLLQFPLIIASNIVTIEEGDFYTVVGAFSIVWAAFLIIAAMLEIHEYSLAKTIFFTVASIFAMLVELFILLLFFSMISQGIAYFVSLFREIMFRM